MRFLCRRTISSKALASSRSFTRSTSSGSLSPARSRCSRAILISTAQTSRLIRWFIHFHDKGGAEMPMVSLFASLTSTPGYGILWAMRAVVQRVSEASVLVAGEVVGQIGPGLAVLVGVRQSDTEADARYLAEKTAHLRVFGDADGRMNGSVVERGGEVLVISQFTLYGDARRGRR